jgi:alpha-L-fucosidase 2
MKGFSRALLPIAFMTACSNGHPGTTSAGAAGTLGPGAAGAGPAGAGAGTGGDTGAAGDSTASGTAGTTGGPGAAAGTLGGLDAAAGSVGTAGSGASGSGPLPPSNLPNQALLYKGTFATPPEVTDTDETTDAPLLGNGDLGVAIFGGIDTLTLSLHKNEFWSLSEAKVKAMARVALAIPSLAGASYAMTEDIGTGEVNGTFTLGGNKVTTKTWVQADDTTQNRVVTQLVLTGTGSVDVSASIVTGVGNASPSATGAMGDILYRDVRADVADAVGGQPTRRVRVAARVVGATGTVAADKLTFTLTAGAPISLVTGVMSNRDDAAYQTRVLASVSSLAPKDVDALEVAHRAWWDRFFKKSLVEIPDKTIEKAYYGSLYLLGSVSRTGEQAPGLWGNWVVKDPAWNGDYTLNYNYEAPFYAAFPTNHVELADSFDQPIVDWLPNAQALATKNGWGGAYFRVHIGPLPNGSGDTNEWNQKFNGAFAASVMIMHYYATRDATYATRIYDTLKQLSIFWQGYLRKDGARYVIDNDAQHEGNAYPQMNGVMSLGFVRFLLQATIDVSTALNVDATMRDVWKDRLANLSAFPTFTKNAKTVFRYTEVGLDWNGGNTIGIQHIYPASQIGLGSDATLLQTAQNMITEMARWNDDNGTNTFYPAAARVGHDPKDILTHLASWIASRSYPNLHIHTGGGGIENFNTVPSTLTEMLLQSFQGKLRLFADWPTTSDARFASLRAFGAFLVSSRLKGGAVQYVQIASEQGGPAVLVNPWPAKTLRLFRDGADAGTVTGPEVTLPTGKGETLSLAPDGTSYADIVSRMAM